MNKISVKNWVRSVPINRREQGRTFTALSKEKPGRKYHGQFVFIGAAAGCARRRIHVHGNGIACADGRAVLPAGGGDPGQKQLRSLQGDGCRDRVQHGEPT